MAGGVHSIVHWSDWYDWYQWNTIYSIGEMHLIMGYFPQLQAEWGYILLVHWFDWHQWNNIYSIGILLVKCISLWDISVGFRLSGVHSTCPLVRLVPIEYHLFHRYSIGEMHLKSRFLCLNLMLSIKPHCKRRGLKGGLSSQSLYLGCVWAHLFQERTTYIVFSVCLGSHALRTKDMHCI